MSVFRGLRCVVGEVHSAADLGAAIAVIARAKARTVIIVPATLFFAYQREVAALALGARLATFFTWRDGADIDGFFAGYGVDLPACFRHACVFVDKILKGAKPGDLPIEFPTRIRLFVNLKVAKALGLTIPPTLLALADEVIE